MIARLWFERVGVAQVLAGLLRYPGQRRVLFLAPLWTVRARWLVDRLERWSGGGIRGETRSVQLGRTDADGRALAYRREAFQLTLSHAFAAAPGRIPDGMETDEFQRLLGSYVSTKSREALSFVAMVEAEAAEEEAGGEDICHVAFPALGAFSARVLNGVVRSGMTVRAWPNLRSLVECLRFMPGHPREWLSVLRRPGFEDSRVEPAARTAGVVLEEAYWLSLLRYPSSGHMYWVEGSGLDPARVALYCDRPDTVCDSRLHGTAADHGFGWIDGAEPLRHAGHPWRITAAVLRSCLSLLPFRLGAVPWMRWALACAALIRIHCYRELFRRHNVLALHHFIEFSPEAIALCLAARREDVLTFWNVWSVIPFVLSRYRWAMADLILVWGPLDRDFHLACGFQFQGIAEVGMIDADGETANDSEEVRSLRGRLDSKVRFVITAFDTGFDYMSHNSESHVRCFLETVTGLVERHGDWGLIIKPKKRPEDSEALGLGGRLLALERQGRCVLQESSARPGIAAAVADLVVGVPINSAAELGALRGRPTLHLDLTGMVDGPLHQSGKDAGIVYCDVESFVAAIEGIAGGRDDVVRRDAWAPFMDRYGDLGGRHRAAALLGDFVRLRETMPMAPALSEALRLHADRHGEDRVVTRDGKRPGPPLWPSLNLLEILH